MAAITNDCIKIDGITEKYLLISINIDIKPGSHGSADLKLRMTDDGKGENLLRNMKDKLITINSTAEGNSGVLFKGYMTECTASLQLDGEVTDIHLVTASIKSDIKRDNCSFQKKSMKYSEIIKKTLSECGGTCTYTDTRMETKEIGIPIIRYRETPWEFIGRAASRFMLPLVVDETADRPAFTIGIEEKGSAPESGFFGKEYGSFIKTGPYLMRKLRDEDTTITKEDYIGMKVRSFNNYKIGMSASYNGKSMVICAKSASTEGSEMVFTYILGTKELYGPQKTYSHTLHGRCLEGKVVKCENERVKLQLDIDVKSGNTKPEGELYWFNWQPETGNLMYCMPEKDTVVSLYIGSTDEGEAIVINSLRKDKGKDIDDPKKRYLTSLDKKRMLLKEKEMGFSMEDKDDGKTHIKLKDDKEIIFKTDKKVLIQADGKIVMAAKKVNADAKKAVNVVQKSTGINIDDKINIKASMTYMGFGGGVAELPKKAEKLKLKKKPRPEVKALDKESNSSGIIQQLDQIKDKAFASRDSKGNISPEEKDKLVEKMKKVYDDTPKEQRGNILVPQSSKYLKDPAIAENRDTGNRYDDVNYDWPSNGGFKGKPSEVNPKPGDKFDRVGNENGRYVAQIEGNVTQPVENRALPYHFLEEKITDEPSYHSYDVDRDFGQLEDSINEYNNPALTPEENEFMRGEFRKEFDKSNWSSDEYTHQPGKTYSGEIAEAFGSGGGTQWELPMSVRSLKELGMIRET